MKCIILILYLTFLVGCATVDTVGSKAWHKQRLQEIEIAYKNKELTAIQYLTLKNETDLIYNMPDSPNNLQILGQSLSNAGNSALNSQPAKIEPYKQIQIRNPDGSWSYGTMH